ncbi:DUF6036 family nucleotidyltransferase [Frankia sp. CiP3]|uniref:DUF6036 family nucleotidyltransferase n=1 Tax=Frankia sp. CiP3 TaxID=2880971 RepID=UPI001EF6EB12|nr:DUF6036 family nucleotidyltransferase [Frankia sp. CiP3]
MRREQLEHVLRAASSIAADPEILVIGSQSVLGAIPEDRLPEEATASIEVDIAFFDDVDETKADLVDGAIGELSPFHETFGYYAQGVSVSTAVLPEGWRERIIIVETPNTAPGRGHCLDPHDCVVSKLVAGRAKDFAFADALVHERLVDPEILRDRIETLETHPMIIQRLRSWVTMHLPAS